MSKFGGNRGGRSGGFNRNSGGSKSNGFGGNRNSDRGNSRGASGGGGGYSRGSRGGGRGGNDNSMKIGDISVSDKILNEIGPEALDELRGSKLSLYLKVYPPKGVDEITLGRGDYLNIILCESKHGGERTVGFVTVSQGNDK